MNLRSARAISAACAKLSEAYKEIDEAVSATGSDDVTQVRRIIGNARSHIFALLFKCAWCQELPPGLNPRNIEWGEIPEDAKDHEDERGWMDIGKDRDHWKQQVIDLRKVMIDNGLPTDGDVDERGWLDGVLKQGRDAVEGGEVSHN